MLPAKQTRIAWRGEAAVRNMVCYAAQNGRQRPDRGLVARRRSLHRADHHKECAIFQLSSFSERFFNYYSKNGNTEKVYGATRETDFRSKVFELCPEWGLLWDFANGVKHHFPVVPIFLERRHNDVFEVVLRRHPLITHRSFPSSIGRPGCYGIERRHCGKGTGPLDIR